MNRSSRCPGSATLAAITLGMAALVAQAQQSAPQQAPLQLRKQVLAPTTAAPIAPANAAHYKLLRAGSNTYRIDTRSGQVGIFMLDGTYAWHSVSEVNPPSAPGNFDLVEISGDTVIRMDMNTGTTWLMVRKSGVPELQKIVN